MNNWIALFYVDVIAYPCPDTNSGVSNLYKRKNPWKQNINNKKSQRIAGLRTFQ